MSDEGGHSLLLGDVLDQRVFPCDTWLRKHSQYAFARLSAKIFEIKSTRKLEQVISTGNKNPEIPFFVREHGDL